MMLKPDGFEKWKRQGREKEGNGRNKGVDKGIGKLIDKEK